MFADVVLVYCEGCPSSQKAMETLQEIQTVISTLSTDAIEFRANHPLIESLQVCMTPVFVIKGKQVLPGVTAIQQLIQVIKQDHRFELDSFDS